MERLEDDAKTGKRRGRKRSSPNFPGKLGKPIWRLVESEIEFENVDARFAEQAEGAVGSVLLNELAT